jgi:hydroxymethylpyrimidine pyrophosphatase-like HAD family hydrolase
MRKLAYVFDLDETLVRCDLEHDKAHNFMDFKPISELPNMMRLFKGLCDIGRPVFILTNRHPDVKKQIAEYFKTFPIENIFCRNYCLTEEEMAMVRADKWMEELFLKKMVVDKVEWLNKMAEKEEDLDNYDRVMFYDDHCVDFQKNKALSKKVWVIMPW